MRLLILLLSIFFTLNANVENGKDVYIQNCSNCHRIDMKGGVGKDFNIVSYTRKKKDIIKYVTNPSKTFKEFGYSANGMPKIPLSKQEIKDVSDYIYSIQKFKKWMIK